MRADHVAHHRPRLRGGCVAPEARIEPDQLGSPIGQHQPEHAGEQPKTGSTAPCGAFSYPATDHPNRAAGLPIVGHAAHGVPVEMLGVVGVCPKAIGQASPWRPHASMLLPGMCPSLASYRVTREQCPGLLPALQAGIEPCHVGRRPQAMPGRRKRASALPGRDGAADGRTDCGRGRTRRPGSIRPTAATRRSRRSLLRRVPVRSRCPPGASTLNSLASTRPGQVRSVGRYHDQFVDLSA